MKDVPPARLAEIVPAKWSETRRRVTAIRRLLQEPDQSTETILRYAAELRVSRPMIYKLLGIVRAWDAAGDARPQPTRWSPRDQDADAVLREALADLGNGAAVVRVRERAAEIARTRGLPAPGRQRTNNAMARTPVGTALAQRLSLDGGVLLDAVNLSVTLAPEGTPPFAAVLVVAFDLDRGALLAWTVLEEVVTREARDRLLSGLNLPEAGPAMATSAVPVGGRSDLAAAPRRVRPGSAVRTALGPMIGRVRLLAGGAADPEVDLARVSITDLRQVIEEILGLPDAVAGSEGDA